MLNFGWNSRVRTLEGTGKYQENFGLLLNDAIHEHINLKLQGNSSFASDLALAGRLLLFSTFYSPTGIQPGKPEDSKQSTSSSRAASHSDLKVAVSWSP